MMRQIISIVNWCATPRECDWQAARCAQPSAFAGERGDARKGAADGFPVNRAAARDHPRFVGTDRVFLTAEWQHLAMLNYEVTLVCFFRSFLPERNWIFGMARSLSALSDFDFSRRDCWVSAISRPLEF